MNIDDNYYSKTTKGVTITAFPMFIDERSRPEDKFYFWVYQLCIDNKSGKKLKFLKNAQFLADKHGLKYSQINQGLLNRVYELNDGGYIEQAFSVPLKSESGILYDSYFEVEDEEGQIYKLDVPSFPLESPFDRKVLN